MDKTLVLPYLGGLEGLDLKIKKGQAPDFTRKIVLRSKFFEREKRFAHFSNLILSQRVKIGVKSPFWPILRGRRVLT